jgi:hypothetical protein
MRTNCGATSPSQSGALFFGYSRSAHSQPWPLPYPQQDLAAFLLTRGPYAYFGYGWCGCASTSGSHPFTRPAELDADYGMPVEFCHETATGVFTREWTRATVTLDCNTFNATIAMK